MKSIARWYSLLLLALLPVATVIASPPVVVVNPAYRLILNQDKGSIESFERASGETYSSVLLPGHEQLPLLKIELMDDRSLFQTLSSNDAKTVRITKSNIKNVEQITIFFEEIGHEQINAFVHIRCPKDKPLTYWSLELENKTGRWIGHIQFPVIKIPFDKNPTEENCGRILYSLADGMLVSPITPSTVMGAWKTTKYDVPETWRSPNYPREYSTQMMAYYNTSGSLYLACEDASGMPKMIAPLMGHDGVTMGLGHYPGTKGPGKTKLPYEVVLGTFDGDWYAAADLYRDWAGRQIFCSKKLKERPHFAEWLFNAVVGFAFPMRGQGDWDPPAAVNPEYTPATNALPYLDKLSQKVGTPLLPIVFNWEHEGPWVQPEAFPPLGGTDAMKKFMNESKRKGWHPVLYGDAVNWVVEQKNTGYNGIPYFKAQGGESIVCRDWNGKATLYPGCRGARMFYATCAATEGCRNMVLEMTRKMTELGPDVIQQFDQLAGALPCYANDHGHAPVPGPWMTSAFKNLLQQDNKVARSINPSVAMAVEGAPPEVYLQDFELWDARTGGAGHMMCPLFSYLYHEYIVAHAGFLTNSVNDEALRASVARALVSGYFLNFTLRDKGRIEYDWDETWDRAVPDQEAILDWAKRATALRNGVGKDFLVFGKMQRPWKVTNVPERDFGHGKEPLVYATTWKSQDGRTAIVLANYSDVKQIPRVALQLTSAKEITLYIDDKKDVLKPMLPGVLDVEMPSRSVALIEIK